MSPTNHSIRSFFAKRGYLVDLLLAWLLAFLVCLVTCCSLSPLYPLNNYDYMNGDSNLFRYYAWLWLQGRTPYVDFYDHKGLYHLAVDALGLLIGGGSRYGIFLLEVVASSCNLFFLARSVRLLWGNDWKALAFAYSMYFGAFAILGQGNSEGEWILPITSLFVYFYLRALKENEARFFIAGSFFMGLEVGLAFNSRPLDAIWGGMGAVYYLVHYFRRERDLRVLWNVLIALLGCAIPFLIIYPLAVEGGYFQEMMKALFMASGNYLLNRWQEFNPWTFCNRTVALCGLIYAIFCFHSSKKKSLADPEVGEFFLIMGAGANALYLLVLGFFHYFQSGFTFFILAYLYSLRVWPWEETRAAMFQKILSYGMSACFVVFSCLYVVGYYTVGFSDFSYKRSKGIQEVLESNIPAEAWEEGKVFAIDCDPAIYLDEQEVVAERFCSYTGGWSRDNPAVKPEIRAYLVGTEHPEYLIQSNTSDYKNFDYADIVEEHYTHVCYQDGLFVIYQWVA